MSKLADAITKAQTHAIMDLQATTVDLERQLAEQKRITDSIINTDVAGLRKAWNEARERGSLLEKGIRFLLLRITRVEGERNEAIRHEQRFRDRLARILKEE